MPISANLEQQFSSLSTTENQDKGTSVPVVSPTKSELNTSVFSASDDEASQGSSDGVTMLIRKTEHKLLEEQGMLDDEPLLKANPYRFVLFPIQDSEVRCRSYLLSKSSLQPVGTHPSMFSRHVNISSGKCTKRPRHLSGHRKRLILVAI